MPALVNQGENIQRIARYLIIDEMRKRMALPSAKTVRTDMVAPSPVYDRSNGVPDSILKFVTQTRKNRGIVIACFLQVVVEKRAEDDLHLGPPKTSSKERPRSLPDWRSASRDCSSCFNSSSLGPLTSRLLTSNSASWRRCSGGSESASSARWVLVEAMGKSYRCTEFVQAHIRTAKSHEEAAKSAGASRRKSVPERSRVVEPSKGRPDPLGSPSP